MREGIMPAKELDERVAALEEEVARVRKEIRSLTNGTMPWWEKINGVFGDDPAFKEAMRLGREYRESLRPKPRKRRKR